MADSRRETRSLDIKFSFYKTKSKPQEISSSRSRTLGEAIMGVVPDFNVNNYVLFAELRDHPDKVAVTPFLLCRWLKENGRVTTKKKPSGNTLKEEPEDSRDYSEQSIFFIKTAEKPTPERITKSSRPVYEGKDLCIAAIGDETLREALLNDQRLANADRFKLYRSDDRHCEVSLDVKSSKYQGVIFDVAVDKRGKKRKESASAEDYAGPAVKKEPIEENWGESSPTATRENIQACSPIISLPRSAADSTSLHNSIKTETSGAVDLPAEGGSEQLEGIYVFPQTGEELTNQKMFEIMEKSATFHARTVLVPRDKHQNYQKEICKLAVHQFALQNLVCRPARLTKKLAPLIDSVGRIHCGDISATCFLISNDMVITNYHVIQMILNARRASAGSNLHQNIFVEFDHEVAGFDHVSHNVKVQPLKNGRNIYSREFDYAILRLDRKMKKKVLESRVLLGPEIICDAPDSGVVVIIGYPYKREKLDENCLVLPRHQRVEKISQRLKNKEKDCHEDPEACVLNAPRGSDIKCVHMYKIFDENIKHKVAYDVGSMFEGTSGSPVFNIFGKIVALHTQGYRLISGKRNTSIFEVGVTFRAIIEDLKRKGKAEMVTKIFPNAETPDVEHMDID